MNSRRFTGSSPARAPYHIVECVALCTRTNFTDELFSSSESARAMGCRPLSSPAARAGGVPIPAHPTEFGSKFGSNAHRLFWCRAARLNNPRPGDRGHLPRAQGPNNWPLNGRKSRSPSGKSTSVGRVKGEHGSPRWLAAALLHGGSHGVLGWGFTPSTRDWVTLLAFGSERASPIHTISHRYIREGANI